MHSLVRRYIKTAIAFLFIGLAIGGWMIVRRVNSCGSIQTRSRCAS
jgi:hypothetical protein